MAQPHDVLTIDDKQLRMAEEGAPAAGSAPSMPVSRGIANPAPLGLLCFGMTTGGCLTAFGSAIAFGSAVKASFATSENYISAAVTGQPAGQQAVYFLSMV